MADAVASLGLDLSEFVRGLAGAQSQLSKAAEKSLRAAQRVAAEAMREQAGALKAQRQLEAENARAAAAAQQEQIARERKLAAEAQRRAEEQGRAMRALASLAAQGSEVERLTHAYEEQVREIKRLVEVTGDQAAGDKAAAAAAAKHAAAIDRLSSEARDEATALKAAERAAKDAERAAVEAGRESAKSWKGLGELLGVPVDQVEKLGDAMGLLGSPVAAVAGGAAIAAAAVLGAAAAMTALVSGAIALEEEVGPLRSTGLLPPIDPAFLTGLSDADLAMAGASVRLKDLGVRIGGAFAPAVEYGAVVLAELADATVHSGVTFDGLGRVIRTGAVVALQTLADWALMIPSLYARMAGVVGSALQALGFDEVGSKIQGVSRDLLDFKNSIGETVAGGAFDTWSEGLTLMGRSAKVGGADLRALGAAAKAAADKAPVEKLRDGTKEAAKQAADAAKAARQWADEQGRVNAAAQGLVALGPELEDLIGVLNRYAAEAIAQQWADAEEGVKSFQAEVRSLATGPLKAAAAGAKGLAGELASAGGLNIAAFTDPVAASTELIRIGTEAIQGQRQAQEALTAARTAGAEAVGKAEAELAAAMATGDSGAITSARKALESARAESQAGIKAAKADLEAASPAAFVRGLVDGAAEMVTGITKAAPAILKGLLAGVPGLIRSLVQGIPSLVQALVRYLPEIATQLAVGIGVELPIALLANLPGIVKALALGLADAFVAAGRRIKNLFRDIFREALTGGRAKTSTFGDTPGPVRVSSQGLSARFAPGDYVVAARTPEGLRAQMGGPPGQRRAEAGARVELDFRDGPLRVGMDRRIASQVGALMAIRNSSGRRSPWGP